MVLFALLAQATLIVGMGAIPAAMCATLRTLDIPMAFVWSMFILGKNPTALQVGGALILLSACNLLVAKQMLELRRQRRGQMTERVLGSDQDDGADARVALACFDHLGEAGSESSGPTVAGRCGDCLLDVTARSVAAESKEPVAVFAVSTSSYCRPTALQLSVDCARKFASKESTVSTPKTPSSDASTMAPSSASSSFQSGGSDFQKTEEPREGCAT